MCHYLVNRRNDVKVKCMHTLMVRKNILKLLGPYVLIDGFASYVYSNRH